MVKVLEGMDTGISIRKETMATYDALLSEVKTLLDKTPDRDVTCALAIIILVQRVIMVTQILRYLRVGIGHDHWGLLL